jgi:glucan phosphoethanolaminetransferase (alkaline phosphatase superfamily)
MSSDKDLNYAIIAAKVGTMLFALLATVGFGIMMGSNENEKLWQGVAFGVLEVMLICVVLVNYYFSSSSFAHIASLVFVLLVAIFYIINETTTLLSPIENNSASSTSTTSPTSSSPSTSTKITTRNWIRLGLFCGVFVLYLVQYFFLYQ